MTIGQRHDTWDATLEHSLIACSGAQTENLLPFSTTLANPKPTNAFGESGQGQYGEVSQLDKGFLDRDTTLVTLSIGGNDARFGEVLKQCIMLLTDVCQNSTLGDDTKPMSLAVPEAINGKVKSSIITVLYQVRLKAPNAQVLLMGYPRLFEGSGSCVLGIGSEEAAWLNSMADLLATAMAEAVASANQAAGRQFAWFSDPRTAFSGMGVCGNPENINGIVLGSSGTPGEPSSEPVSQQSFHPKIAGTTNYANSMNATLRLMGL